MSWLRSERSEVLQTKAEHQQEMPNNSMSDNNEAPVKLSLPLVWLGSEDDGATALTRV
jgi:hypothetical protein